jgi:hypothetical protein
MVFQGLQSRGVSSKSFCKEMKPVGVHRVPARPCTSWSVSKYKLCKKCNISEQLLHDGSSVICWLTLHIILLAHEMKTY